MKQGIFPVQGLSGGRLATPSKLQGPHLYYISYPRICRKTCCFLPKYLMIHQSGRFFNLSIPNSGIISIPQANKVVFQVAVRQRLLTPGLNSLRKPDILFTQRSADPVLIVQGLVNNSVTLYKSDHNIEKILNNDASLLQSCIQCLAQ